MTAPTLEILAPIYAAITAASAITTELGSYNGAAAVFTRRPVPDDAPTPMVAIGPMVTRSEDDLVTAFRPSVVVDLLVAGDQKTEYRLVERVAELIYGLFHRQPDAITVDGYSVTQIRATGPSPSPADGDSKVARRVTLTIELFAVA